MWNYDAAYREICGNKNYFEAHNPFNAVTTFYCCPIQKNSSSLNIFKGVSAATTNYVYGGDIVEFEGKRYEIVSEKCDLNSTSGYCTIKPEGKTGPIENWDMSQKIGKIKKITAATATPTPNTQQKNGSKSLEDLLKEMEPEGNQEKTSGVGDGKEEKEKAIEAAKYIEGCMKEGEKMGCEKLQLGQNDDKLLEAIRAQRDVAQQLEDYIKTLSGCNCPGACQKECICGLFGCPCDCPFACTCCSCSCGPSAPCPQQMLTTMADGKKLVGELRANANALEKVRNAMVTAARNGDLLSCAHDVNTDPRCPGFDKEGGKSKFNPFDFRARKANIKTATPTPSKSPSQSPKKSESPSKSPSSSPSPSPTPSPTPQDQDPPVISDCEPHGTLDYSNITLTCKTNEKATCKFDVSDKSFDSMGATFSGSGSTSHSKQVGTLEEKTHKYYVRCADTTGNKNMVSTAVNFTIAVPTVEISDLKPSGTLTNRDVTLSLKTSKSATCKYDTTDKAYESMQYSFTGAGTTSHTKALGQISDGDYKYFVRCKDGSGQTNNISSIIQFKVSIQTACIEVFKSGDSDDNLDIVFVGDNYIDNNTVDLNSFTSTVKKYKDALIAMEPFKANKDRINVWQVSRFPDLKCVPASLTYSDGAHKVNKCDYSLAREVASDCAADQIIIVTKGSSTETANGLSNAVLNSGMSTISSEDTAQLFLHELGHSFAGLSNLYASDPKCEKYKGCLMCDIKADYVYGGLPVGTNSPCITDLNRITDLIKNYGSPSLMR